MGEKLLAQAGVRAGQCLPTGMFQRLMTKELLFTKAGGKRPKPSTLSPSRHPAFQLPGDAAKHRADPPSITSLAARPSTAATDGTRAKTGRVITVMAPPVKRSTGNGGIGRPPKPKKGNSTSGEKEAKTANAPKPKPNPARKRGSVLYPRSANAQQLYEAAVARAAEQTGWDEPAPATIHRNWLRQDKARSVSVDAAGPDEDKGAT